MAVANLCLKEWEEWKRKMEENRSRRWRERVSRWAKVEVSDEEEEDEEDMDCEEDDVSVDEEEMEVEEMAEEGENVAGRAVRNVQEGDEEKDRQEGENEDVEEDEEENEAEREVEEKGEVDEEKERDEVEELEEEEGKEVKEEEEDRGSVAEDENVDAEEEEEENEVEREVEENEEVNEEKEEEVDELEENAGREDKENEEDDEEEDRGMREADEMKEEQDEEEDEVEVEENMEREVMEEEVEGEQEDGEHEFEVNEEVVVEDDRQVREEEEQDNEEEDYWEEDQIQHLLAEQSREQFRGVEDEDIYPNQESRSQEDQTDDDEESDKEDSDSVESEDEYYNFEERAAEEQGEKKSVRTEYSILGGWISVERNEEEHESNKLRDEEETVAKSRTTQQERLQDVHENLEEGETTDEEEAGHSTDEDVDDFDEDLVTIYCKDDYLTNLFSTLAEFRDSCLLTDLTLSTEDGKSILVHSPVLAAVSSLIREDLSRRNVQNDRVGDEGVHQWSLSLDPEVNRVGLEAVVEFAYTGLVPCLNRDTVHQIKVAAEALGAPRVLDLCTKEEEKYTKTGGQKKEDIISAKEEMEISLQFIRQLWMDRVGCDVILKALGGSLHVHRVILAVGNDYFRSMFTLGMKESHQPCVTLPFLLASELEVLIDCSYSGALPLSWNCVFEITSTALQLQYQPALSLCLSFLRQEINPHSCLDVASFAEAYEMADLLEVADDFVLRQFQKVACTSKFKDLPAKQLLRYLNSLSLCVPSELVVFKAVVAWIQAKPKKRLRLAKELMKTIHFPLMTFKEFKEVQSLNMWSDHSLAELYEAVFEDFCSNKTAPQSQCRIYLPKESLVLIGGDQTSEDLSSRSISRELWFGNSLRNHTGIKKAMEWRRLGEMPDPARFSHEVAVLKGQLYVFGGNKYYGVDDTLSSVYRYDPLENSWESLAEMQEKRCSFSVVVLDGRIYAIGGRCDPDYIETVERYCPIANSWRFVLPLDLPLCAHVAKVFKGQIFVSGGLSSNYQYLASMFLYHPERGSTYLANMMTPRAHHCMEALGECLYVAGGITTGNIINTVDELACESYNPATDSWTAFASLPVPHVGAGSVVLEGKFYVLGGYSHEDYSDTKLVHRYDPATQRWENMGKMPGPNNDIRACLLCLPSHFRT